MDISVFTGKEIIPTDKDLQPVLGDLYPLWMTIRDFVFEKYPTAIEEWNYPGKKYGWSFRIKDKRRAIIYLLPRDGYFKVAFVFGQKATDHIMESDINSNIKKELQEARVYAEGRGISIDVRDEGILGDVRRLVDAKIMHYFYSSQRSPHSVPLAGRSFKAIST